MTQPTSNPRPTDAPAQPGKAMRVARLVIAAGLLGACGVFSVYAIRDIGKNLEQNQLPIGDGHDTDPSPMNAPPSSDGSLIGMARLDPTKFIPINRDNPHPGEFTPFRSADAFLQPPYRQPNTADEVWEFCAYRVQNATPRAAFQHYAAQAERRGMKLLYNKPSDQRGAGGLIAAWSDGTRRLELSAWPTPGSSPPLPPLPPEAPLDWVVKYSYPETKGTNRPQGQRETP